MKTTVTISCPADAARYLASFARKRQEHFVVLTLNGAHEVIRRHVVTIGIVNHTVTHAREVFYRAIKDNAESIIVVHNHPSGTTNPSAEDDEVTKRLRAAGEIMGIPVLDHLIIGRRVYHSYQEAGSL